LNLLSVGSTWELRKQISKIRGLEARIFERIGLVDLVNQPRPGSSAMRLIPRQSGDMVADSEKGRLKFLSS
jgi:hypothetical protein